MRHMPELHPDTAIIDRPPVRHYTALLRKPTPSRTDQHASDQPGRLDPARRVASADVAAADALLVERLNTLGRLAEGLSGDLRQSLSVIRNSIYFLKMHLGESLDDKVRRHLSIMLREIRTAGRAVTNLSSLSLKRAPERQPVDVELLAASALGQVTAPPDIVVEQVIPQNARVFGDAEQLACAIANVIINSVQAMPAGGKVRIVCRPEPTAVALAIADEGQGMTDEVMARAFEPLFTTSPHRAGLGLTVVRSLVGANGGQVELESRPGHGTTVTFRLPKPDQPPAAQAR